MGKYYRIKRNFLIGRGGGGGGERVRSIGRKIEMFRF